MAASHTYFILFLWQYTLKMPADSSGLSLAELLNLGFLINQALNNDGTNKPNQACQDEN